MVVSPFWFLLSASFDEEKSRPSFPVSFNEKNPPTFPVSFDEKFRQSFRVSFSFFLGQKFDGNIFLVILLSHIRNRYS